MIDQEYYFNFNNYSGLLFKPPTPVQIDNPHFQFKPILQIMKTQIHPNGVTAMPCPVFWLVRAGLIVAFCSLSACLFAQSAEISSIVNKQTYKLTDPNALLTATELQTAIITAETAGKALTQDAAAEKDALLAIESDLTRAQTMRSDYLTALDSYTKNGYDPYMVDFNSYIPNLNNYNESLRRHNTATDANNALAPEQRNAANVASLNSEKTELDSWRVKLENWKNSLDAARTKLDDQRAALLKQKQDFETARQLATGSLKAAKFKLKTLVAELLLCSYYSDKCRYILLTKFSFNGPTGTGYFGTTGYKSTLAGLNAEIENLKTLPGMVWDED